MRAIRWGKGPKIQVSIKKKKEKKKPVNPKRLGVIRGEIECTARGKEPNEALGRSWGQALWEGREKRKRASNKQKLLKKTPTMEGTKKSGGGNSLRTQQQIEGIYREEGQPKTEEVPIERWRRWPGSLT